MKTHVVVSLGGKPSCLDLGVNFASVHRQASSSSKGEDKHCVVKECFSHQALTRTKSSKCMIKHLTFAIVTSLVSFR